MPKVFFGGKNEAAQDFELSDDLIAVRKRSRQSATRLLGPVPSPQAAALDDGALVVSFPEAGVEVYRVPVGRGKRSLDDRKTALRATSDVRFAGGVLVDHGIGAPA